MWRSIMCKFLSLSSASLTMPISYLGNGTNFGKCIWYRFWFSVLVFIFLFESLDNSAILYIYVGLHVKCYFCRTLIRIEFGSEIWVHIPKIKFTKKNHTLGAELLHVDWQTSWNSQSLLEAVSNVSKSEYFRLLLDFSTSLSLSVSVLLVYTGMLVLITSYLVSSYDIA
jgi:hypothetical protein